MPESDTHLTIVEKALTHLIESSIGTANSHLSIKCQSFMTTYLTYSWTITSNRLQSSDVYFILTVADSPFFTEDSSPFLDDIETYLISQCFRNWLFFKISPSIYVSILFFIVKSYPELTSITHRELANHDGESTILIAKSLTSFSSHVAR